MKKKTRTIEQAFLNVKNKTYTEKPKRIKTRYRLTIVSRDINRYVDRKRKN